MKKYIDCVIREIEEKSFAITQQYLEVNSVLKVDGQYAIERIEDESADELVVYFKIAGERYYLGIRVDKNKVAIAWAFIENGNRCYLIAISKELSLKQLTDGMRLKHTSGYSKGAIENYGTARYKNTVLRFDLLDSECYNTEDALALLLDKLEPHKEEIAELAKKSSVCICIHKHPYVSGDMELYFDVSLLNRLAALNIDPYISGTPINDTDE